MKTKVKIINVTPRPNHPVIIASVINVETYDVIYYENLPAIFRWLEANDGVIECINLGKDRFGLPYVIE